jgi:hypothetical protein
VALLQNPHVNLALLDKALATYCGERPRPALPQASTQNRGLEAQIQLYSPSNNTLATISKKYFATGHFSANLPQPFAQAIR